MMKRDQLLIPGQYSAIPNVVLKHPTLKPATKLVYAAILERLGENLASWPGKNSIADDTGLSLSGVKAAIAQLIETGLIGVETGGIDAKGNHISNRYFFFDPVAVLPSLPPRARRNLGRDATQGDTRAESNLGVGRGATYPRARSDPELGRDATYPRARSDPELPKITTEETTEVKPPKETTPLGGGVPPLAEPQPPAAIPSPLMAAAPAFGTAPALGAIEVCQPKTRTQDEIITGMYRAAVRAGLSEPESTGEKKFVLAALRASVKTIPFLPDCWGTICTQLADRKGFSSKNLKWLLTHKTQPNKKRVYNWQLVAGWIFTANNAAFFPAVKEFLKQRKKPFTAKRAARYYELLIAQPVARAHYPTPNSFFQLPRRAYIGLSIENKYGSTCSIVQTVGGIAQIQFHPEGERYKVPLAQLMSDYEPIPPKPQDRIEQLAATL